MVDVWTAVGYLVLGSLLGVAGQLIRIVVGLKKLQQECRNEAMGKTLAANATFAAEVRKEYEARYDPKKLRDSLLISAVVGAVAGIFAAIEILGMEITRELILSIIAAGYAGTDFIEGVMKERLPKV